MIDLRPLREQPIFLAHVAAMTAVLAARQAIMVALLFEIWRRTQSPFWVGAVGLAFGLPIVVVGLWSGALADRIDRRRLALCGIAAKGALALLLALEVGRGGGGLALLFGLIAAMGVAGALGAPALATFPARLLAPERLAAGLALAKLGQQSGKIAAPLLAGVVIAAFGAAACFALGAHFAGLACAALWLLPPNQLAARSAKAAPLDEMAAACAMSEKSPCSRAPS